MCSFHWYKQLKGAQLPFELRCQEKPEEEKQERTTEIAVTLSHVIDIYIKESYISIHPSIHHQPLIPVTSWRQRLKQGAPNLPFSGNINQLWLGVPEAFPRQRRDIRDIFCPVWPSSQRGTENLPLIYHQYNLLNFHCKNQILDTKCSEGLHLWLGFGSCTKKQWLLAASYQVSCV